MTLTKYKLGDLIEQVNIRNKDLDKPYPKERVKGISTNKEFIETKANLEGVSLKSYKLVKQFQFAYVADTSRRGNKISLAFNDDDSPILVSSISTIFEIINKNILDPYYLFMYFNRNEFDRFSRFNSWGSARETFSWEDFCDIKIDLPTIDIQKKYVNIYKSMKKNQKNYINGIEDLKLVCDATVEKLKGSYEKESIGKYMIKGRKNSDEEFNHVLGLGGSGFIIPQKEPNKSLKNYKIMSSGAIVYAPPLYNINSDAIQLYRLDESSICSPIYEVFYTQRNNLLPEYLMIWLKRDEFKRYAAFKAMGVRNTFDYENMEELAIPIPPLNIQKALSDMYASFKDRKLISRKLKNKLKEICPILIKGAMEEASRNEV